MTGRIIDLSRNLSGTLRVTLELTQADIATLEALKDIPILDVELKKHRKKRSKDANSYLHLLLGKIAERQGLGIEEVKRKMVSEYGTYTRDEDGSLVGLKLPASVKPETVYPYTKFIEDRTENGKPFKCYLIFKQTHMMDTAEMARLIAGVVFEARALGIETDTPEQIERMKSLWEQAERSRK